MAFFIGFQFATCSVANFRITISIKQQKPLRVKSPNLKFDHSTPSPVMATNPTKPNTTPVGRLSLLPEATV